LMPSVKSFYAKMKLLVIYGSLTLIRTSKESSLCGFFVGGQIMDLFLSSPQLSSCKTQSNNFSTIYM